MSRPYDILLWGATGFTGGLVLDYLISRYSNDLRIAVGGRSESKLAARLGGENSKIKIFVADLTDRSNLINMLSQCKVCISTAGPFSHIGSPLVSACIDSGCDYCDITGESTWVKTLQEEFGNQAKSKGVLILNCCGFDSLPADLTSFIGCQRLREIGAEPGESHSFVKLDGSASGGTIQTIFLLADRGVNGSKYLLNSSIFAQSARAANRPHDADQIFMKFHSTIGWTIPFIMAAVNTRIVRKSAEQVNFSDSKGDRRSLYGDNFSYNESVVVGRGNFFPALLAWLGLALFGLVLAFRFTRNAVKRFLPQSGDGPTKEKREKSRFLYTNFVRPTESTKFPSIKVTMKGGDPGYDETAKMVSEVAITILKHKAQLPEDSRAGIRTTATLGQFLVDRSQSTGTIKLKIEEINPGQPEKIEKF